MTNRNIEANGIWPIFEQDESIGLYLNEIRDDIRPLHRTMIQRFKKQKVTDSHVKTLVGQVLLGLTLLPIRIIRWEHGMEATDGWHRIKAYDALLSQGYTPEDIGKYFPVRISSQTYSWDSSEHKETIKNFFIALQRFTKKTSVTDDYHLESVTDDVFKHLEVSWGDSDVNVLGMAFLPWYRMVDVIAGNYYGIPDKSIQRVSTTKGFLRRMVQNCGAEDASEDAREEFVARKVAEKIKDVQVKVDKALAPFRRGASYKYANKKIPYQVIFGIFCALAGNWEVLKDATEQQEKVFSDSVDKVVREVLSRGTPQSDSTPYIVSLLIEANANNKVNFNNKFNYHLTNFTEYGSTVKRRAKKDMYNCFTSQDFVKSKIIVNKLNSVVEYLKNS